MEQSKIAEYAVEATLPRVNECGDWRLPDYSSEGGIRSFPKRINSGQQ